MTMAKHYSIQQAAALTQVSTHTLRFYERIGLLRNVARAKNGHRRYSEEDLGWVRFVMLLRTTDMPLPQIATFMKLEKDGQTTIDKRLQLLEGHRADLSQHIAELARYLTALDAKIDYYRHTTSDVCDCVRTEAREVNAPATTPTRSHQRETPCVVNHDRHQPHDAS